MKNSELIVYLVENKSLGKLPQKQLLADLGFKGFHGETAFLPETPSMYLGLELKPVKTTDPFYKIDYYALGAILGTKLRSTKYRKLQIDSKSLTANLDPQNCLDLALGVRQGAWKFTKFLKNEKEEKGQFYLDFGVDMGKDWCSKLDALDSGISLTRTLVEETPEDLNPSMISDLVKSEVGRFKNISIKIHDKADLQKMGMRSILAVGRASIHAPVLVHAVLKPKNQVKSRIVLIGKGLTYDSGGLDIKTGGHMRTMKMDMGGAGTMMGVMKTLGQLELENTELHWLSAFVENMVGGDAYKTDDVITTHSGQTVEIWNTDAEGRMTLADVLSYATSLDPDSIIDAATLTGACIAANSDYYTGLMGNDEILINGLMDAFISTNEPTEKNPLPEELRQYVKGEISDLVNTSSLKGQAGHITAGLFLSHFVDQNLFRFPHGKVNNPKCYPWVHLDVAGSVYNSGHNQLKTKGATGQSVRGLVEWILTLDKRN